MEMARWYFDLISPFAYLHYHRLLPLRDRLEIQPVPVLFAGLLKHWGNKGPAEVPPKRLHTYQYCVWAAAQQNLPFHMPARHPFNSLAAQRLLVALGAPDQAVKSAFDFVYGDGRDPELDIAALCQRLGHADGDQLIAQPAVKQQLIANTEDAIASGVFGVSTLVVRGRIFWGSDTVPWASQFLDEPELFDQPGYREALASEFGVART